MVIATRLIGCFVAAAAAFAAPSAADAAWVPNGIPVCPAAGGPGAPLIISDENGGAIIAWTDGRNGNADIYAQRISADGEYLWGADGLCICDDPATQKLQDMAPDGCGGAILVWGDARTPDSGIYAQSVSAEGVARWTCGGAPVCIPFPGCSSLKIVPAGEGEAIVAWIRYEENTPEGENAIYAQKMTAGGLPAWTSGGVLCASIVECFNMGFFVVSDSQGGAIIISRCILLGCLWGQRIDGDGNPCWGPNGHEVARSAYDPYGMAVASDGFGGALAIFRDGIYGGGIITIDVLRAQRIAPDGTALWPTTMCLDYDDFTYMAIAPDETGGAIAVWCRYFATDGSALWVQRLDAAGSFLWGSGRSATWGINWFDLGPRIISDGSGGAIVIWQDKQEGTNDQNIYAQRLNQNGDVLWGDLVALCAEYGDQTNPAIATNCAGGAIVAWMDGRSLTQAEIYAQTICAEGVPGEPPVAALLQSFSSSASMDGIEVRWTISDARRASDFNVERAEGAGGAFEYRAVPIECEGLSYRFIDRGVAAGTGYRYRVISAEGEGQWILFETNLIRMPVLPLTLYQNFPNPFNPATRISYYLPEAATVLLEVYDSSGRRVAVLAHEHEDRGLHSVEWTALSETGRPFASSVYFCRLSAGKSVVSRKITIIR
jgi:hypothetical protein